MARSACCSSRVKVVRGTSSDTGRTATVDRLDAWFPASHWLPEVWRARLRPEDQRRRTLGKSCCRRPVGGAAEAGPVSCLLSPEQWTHTCQRTVDLLQDLLPQQVDQPGDDLPTTTRTLRRDGSDRKRHLLLEAGRSHHPPEGTSS